MRLRFLTSTPLSIRRGSGTFVGIETLAKALRALGTTVEIVAPRIHLPVYTLERLLFNELLRFRSARGFDATVGFDMDGYRVAGCTGVPHVAALKGVIADEVRFESGTTRATMAVQARCEASHVRRANLVITTSRYSSDRAKQFYRLSKDPAIVPELIDLAGWRQLLQRNTGPKDPNQFTVLCVCRLYRRKRVELLLGAAARLRQCIPGLQIRIVGDGPQAADLHKIGREKRLESTVHWLGDVARTQLAAEYNRCDVFCLPSVQEGFGIVFLEAMAAGKPIVATRAAAIPEVVRHGVLAEPENVEGLTEAIQSLYRSPDLGASLGAAGARSVEEFDAPLVAERFLAVMERVLR